MGSEGGGAPPRAPPPAVGGELGPTTGGPLRQETRRCGNHGTQKTRTRRVKSRTRTVWPSTSALPRARRRGVSGGFLAGRKQTTAVRLRRDRCGTATSESRRGGAQRCPRSHDVTQATSGSSAPAGCVVTTVVNRPSDLDVVTSRDATTVMVLTNDAARSAAFQVVVEMIGRRYMGYNRLPWFPRCLHTERGNYPLHALYWKSARDVYISRTRQRPYSDLESDERYKICPNKLLPNNQRVEVLDIDKSNRLVNTEMSLNWTRYDDFPSDRADASLRHHVSGEQGGPRDDVTSQDGALCRVSPVNNNNTHQHACWSGLWDATLSTGDAVRPQRHTAGLPINNVLWDDDSVLIPTSNHGDDVCSRPNPWQPEPRAASEPPSSVLSVDEGVRSMSSKAVKALFSYVITPYEKLQF